MGLHLRIGPMRRPALGPAAAHARANVFGTAHHAISAVRQTANSKPHNLGSQSSCLTSLHGVRSGPCSGLVSRRAWPLASAAQPTCAGAQGHPGAIPTQHTGSKSDMEIKPTHSQPQASLFDVLLNGDSVETGGPRSAPADLSRRRTRLPPLHKELLQLEDKLRDGSIRSGEQEDRVIYMVRSFWKLAKFDPLSLNASAKLTHAAGAARLNLMHALAAEFIPLLPKVNQRNYLATALLACGRTGYGWGPTAAPEAAGAEGELPLAQAVLDRLLQMLNRAPDVFTELKASMDDQEAMMEIGLQEMLYAAASGYPGGGASVAGMPFTPLEMHKSAHPVLLAVVRLRPNVLRDPGPVAGWLFPRLEYPTLGDDAQLCEVTQALGELVVQAPALCRARESKPGAVAPWVPKLVGVVQARLEQQEEWVHCPWRRQQKQGMVSGEGLGVRQTCQLLRGCLGLYESFKGGASSSNDGGAAGGGVGGGGPDSLERVAADAAAAAGLAASQLERLEFLELAPPELSEATYTLARFGYGSNDCYRAVAAAAAAAQETFHAAATPADWAQLWHALALVKHRPNDALVRRTAAAMMTKQEQCGSATAHDCATLLWSLAVLRCYDNGLVGWLLGRLVQLLQAVPPSGGDVPGGGVRVHDLTSSLWSVAVMGPELLAVHCGAVGQLLSEVAGRWEQGRMGEGEEREQQQVQEQGQVLRQLWQVQLELEAVADGHGAGGSGRGNTPRGSGGDSGESSCVSVDPEQLRQLLPVKLLRQAKEEVVRWEGPGGAGRGASGRRLHVVRDEVWGVLQGMVRGGQQGQQLTVPLPSGSHSTAAGGSPPARIAIRAGAAPVLWDTVVISVVQNAPLPELPYCVDFLVEMADGRRLAVEVEGPGQLLANHPHTGTRTGPAELRRRQLERVLGAGCVLGVRYWEWEELGGERGRQEAWLGARLAAGMCISNGGSSGSSGSSGEQGTAAVEK